MLSVLSDRESCETSLATVDFCAGTYSEIISVVVYPDECDPVLREELAETMTRIRGMSNLTFSASWEEAERELRPSSDEYAQVLLACEYGELIADEVTAIFEKIYDMIHDDSYQPIPANDGYPALEVNLPIGASASIIMSDIEYNFTGVQSEVPIHKILPTSILPAQGITTVLSMLSYRPYYWWKKNDPRVEIWLSNLAVNYYDTKYPHSGMELASLSMIIASEQNSLPPMVNLPPLMDPLSPI